MPLFDWEKRIPPEGLIQINRNRQRDEAIRAIQCSLKEEERNRHSAIWSSKIEKKLKTVASVLREVDCSESTDKTSSKSETRGFLLKDTDEILKMEAQAKKDLMEARKRIAQDNRKTLLERGHSLMIAATENRQSTLQNLRYQDNGGSNRETKPSYEDLKEYWKKQIEEKMQLNTLQNDTRRGLYSDQASTSSMIPRQTQPGCDHGQGSFQKELAEVLIDQMEEQEKRREIEKIADRMKAEEITQMINTEKEIHERALKSQAKARAQSEERNQNYMRWMQQESRIRKSWLDEQEQANLCGLLGKMSIEKHDGDETSMGTTADNSSQPRPDHIIPLSGGDEVLEGTCSHAATNTSRETAWKGEMSHFSIAAHSRHTHDRVCTNEILATNNALIAASLLRKRAEKEAEQNERLQYEAQAKEEETNWKNAKETAVRNRAYVYAGLEAQRVARNIRRDASSSK